MDALTQGILGAAVGQAALGHKAGNRAGVIGLLAGVRAIYRILRARQRKHGIGVEKVLVVGAGEVGRAVMRNIRQNLFFAFIYNSMGVPVAAGILYPVFGLLLSPIIAAAAMSFSSVSVISNSLRLRKARI